jgi:uncharacterized protein YfaP (DUF2135 family)
VTHNASGQQEAHHDIKPDELAGTDNSTRSTISLWWDDPSIDLDLKLITPFPESVPEHQVSYMAKGRGDAPPWAFLDEDVQSGGARSEAIHITRWVAGTYRILVDNYTASSSTNAPRFPRSINLEILIDGRSYHFSPPSNVWKAWIVAELGPDGEVREDGRAVG